MRRRLPLGPTILVAAAVMVMIALGFWQMQRAAEKAVLIERAQTALQSPAETAYPSDPVGIETAMYHRTRIVCARVLDTRSGAGTSARGQKGWAHGVTCALPDGGQADVDLGFSANPREVRWGGGDVVGTITPGGRVVAANGLAGLEPLARPDPRDLPNNHLAYAGQWFFFALTALAIYALVVRKRWQEASPR